MSAASLLLGFALASAPAGPAAGAEPIRSRTVTVPIEYSPALRKTVQQVQLFASVDKGSTWQCVATITPEKESISYTAKDDGVVLLMIVTTFRDGKVDPRDPGHPPADRVNKLLLDATAPVVTVDTARRDGDEIELSWDVKDSFPDDKTVKVEYRPVGGTESDWRDVPADKVTRRTARFRPAVAGAVSVRVSAADLCGNPGSMTRDLPAGGPSAVVTASAASVPPAPSFPAEAPGGLVAPSLAPTPAPAAAPVADSNAVGWQSADAPRPIAVGAGAAAPPPPAPAAPEAPTNAQVINQLRFELQYQVENGPSGLSRVELYVTRDEGRTWLPWSQHDGRESPLRVALDARSNRTVEGDYGLKIVPVSGAGLSDGAPAAGTPPELRLHVDVTPPFIEVYAPEPDPQHRNALLLKWKATDRNFGRDPISIEWSEGPNGPWKPVTLSNGVVPVVAGPIGSLARVPNTGNYSWLLPSGMTSHKVHLRFSAWDVAGNKSDTVTPAVQVDLVKPRAKIQGIVAGGAPPRIEIGR